MSEAIKAKYTCSCGASFEIAPQMLADTWAQQWHTMHARCRGEAAPTPRAEQPPSGGEQPASEPGVWRVGRKLGRTIYRGDQIVGMADTPELAAEIVRAMNGTWLCSLCHQPHPRGKSHSECLLTER